MTTSNTNFRGEIEVKQQPPEPWHLPEIGNEKQVNLLDPLKLLPQPFCYSEDQIVEALNKGWMASADYWMNIYHTQARTRGYLENPDFVHNRNLLQVELTRIKLIYFNLNLLKERTCKKQQEEQEQKMKFCGYM